MSNFSIVSVKPRQVKKNCFIEQNNPTLEKIRRVRLVDQTPLFFALEAQNKQKGKTTSPIQVKYE
jgi:hypothetical protein